MSKIVLKTKKKTQFYTETENEIFNIAVYDLYLHVRETNRPELLT